MADEITQLQEEIAHQAMEISRLSDELYAQQKEISQMKDQLSTLKDSLESGANIRSQAEETPPPHY